MDFLAYLVNIKMDDNTTSIIAFVILLSPLIFGVIFYNQRKKIRTLELYKKNIEANPPIPPQYANLIDLDKEVNQRKELTVALETNLNLLREKYQSKNLSFDDYLELENQKQARNNELQKLKQAITELEKKYENKEIEYHDLLDKYTLIKDHDDALVQVEQDIAKLKEDYQAKKAIYDSLVHQVALYDETLELAEIGVYKPHFDFGTAENYKKKIIENREKQKELVKSNLAVTANTEWTVEGSYTKGQQMIKEAKNLALRSFNNECDVIIKNTTWKNIDRMRMRISKAFNDINKFNQSNDIRIENGYLALKHAELQLVFEHSRKAQEEREIQAELRRREAEEEQLKREADKARKEEEKLQALLKKIVEKSAVSSGQELEKLQSEIITLSAELKEMQRKNDRVKAMAEQTKLGYVYIISNIGSFGENVFKIGLTRRVEPLERIRELSSASVPFVFDVHAMIFSEDAPALESYLHKAFAEKRINLINNRKEFFRVSLDEIKEELIKIKPDVDIVEEVEAQEYYQTLELLKPKEQVEVLPESI